MRHQRAAILITAPLLVTIHVVSPTQSAASGFQNEEVKALHLISDARALLGLPPLRMHPALVDIARRHSERMLASDGIYHNNNLTEEMNATGLPWAQARENVGRGYGTESIHKAYMKSASHLPNILSREHEVVGIGVMRTDTGRFYQTQVFVELQGTSAPSPQDAPSPQPASDVNPSAAQPASFEGEALLGAPSEPFPEDGSVAGQAPAAAPAKGGVDPNAVMRGKLASESWSLEELLASEELSTT